MMVGSKIRRVLRTRNVEGNLMKPCATCHASHLGGPVMSATLRMGKQRWDTLRSDMRRCWPFGGRRCWGGLPFSGGSNSSSKPRQRHLKSFDMKSFTPFGRRPFLCWPVKRTAGGILDGCGKGAVQIDQ